MGFGTALRRKSDVAEGVSVAVGHVATRRGNRLGVVAFGGREPRVLRPRQGRLGLLALLAELRAEPPADGAGATSLGEAAQRMAALTRARGLVVVVVRLPWPARLGERAAVVARAPRRAGRRGARPARAGAAGRGRRVDGRSGDRPPDRRQHEPPQAARGASTRPRWPSARRSRWRCAAPAPTISCCRPTATGCAVSPHTCAAPTRCAAARWRRAGRVAPRPPRTRCPATPAAPLAAPVNEVTTRHRRLRAAGAQPPQGGGAHELPRADRAARPGAAAGRAAGLPRGAARRRREAAASATRRCCPAS